MKKVLSFTLAITLFASIFTGCGAKTPASTDENKPFAGTEIRFVATAHGWTNAIVELLPEFEEATGIKVNVETYEINQQVEKISVELTAQNQTLDVFFMRPLSEGKIGAKNGWYEPLDDRLTDESLQADDFIQSSLDSFVFDGKTYGVPICTETQILYYRKDLFEQAGLDGPPKTLDEMYQYAEILNNPEDGVCGFVSRGTAMVANFQPYLLGFGSKYQDENGDSCLNLPGSAQAFEYYGKILHNYGPAGVLSMGENEVAALFAQGKAAMLGEFTGMYASAASPDASDYSDVIGYAPWPAGPGGDSTVFVAGHGLSIGAYSKQKDASWEFIKWATSVDVNNRIHASGIFSSRQSAMDDPELNKNIPAEMLTAIQESNKIGFGVDRPTTTAYAKVRDIIFAVLQDSISTGGENMDALVEQAHVDIQAIYDEFDK